MDYIDTVHWQWYHSADYWRIHFNCNPDFSLAISHPFGVNTSAWRVIEWIRSYCVSLVAQCVRLLNCLAIIAQVISLMIDYVYKVVPSTACSRTSAICLGLGSLYFPHLHNSHLKLFCYATCIFVHFSGQIENVMHWLHYRFPYCSSNWTCVKKSYSEIYSEVWKARQCCRQLLEFRSQLRSLLDLAHSIAGFHFSIESENGVYLSYIQS